MAAIVTDFQNLVQGQNGILFWIAIAAITSGISFLLAGIFLHGRRIWYLRGLRNQRLASAREHGQDRHKSLVYKQNGPEPLSLPDGESSPTTAVPGDANGSDRPGLADRSLPTVLQRLRQAADRLENMADELVGSGKSSSESPLKPLACEVEYVFRASRH